MCKLLLPVVCLPRTARNENRSATPSATDVTPTRFNQLGSGLSNVAARGEGSRPIPSVAPTLENERFYGAADLYGVSGGLLLIISSRIVLDIAFHC